MLMLLESLLGFLVAVAKALVDKQLLNDWVALWELDNDSVDNLCKTVCKLVGSGEEGHQIPEMAMTQLQLLVFYAKHLSHIQRKFDIVGTNLDMIATYKAQKTLEKDWLKNNAKPKYLTKPKICTAVNIFFRTYF